MRGEILQGTQGVSISRERGERKFSEKGGGEHFQMKNPLFLTPPPPKHHEILKKCTATGNEGSFCIIIVGGKKIFFNSFSHVSLEDFFFSSLPPSYPYHDNGGIRKIMRMIHLICFFFFKGKTDGLCEEEGGGKKGGGE